MKKGKICIGTVLLILSLVCLAGCSSQEPEETTVRQTTSAAETSEKEEDRETAGEGTSEDEEESTGVIGGLMDDVEEDVDEFVNEGPGAESTSRE